MKNIRNNNRKSSAGRNTQFVQVIKRDDNGKPITDKAGNNIPIPGKFKCIKH
jgi:hypothetical protein